MTPIAFETVHPSFAGAVHRLCRAVEFDPQRRLDLEQEVWLAIWKALPSFRGDCSVRTFVFRVAHNVAATHSGRGGRDQLVRATSLDDVDPTAPTIDDALDRHEAMRRIQAAIARLKPVDRQIVLLWLEEVPTNEIAEITGLTVTHVTTKTHRIRGFLAGEVSNVRA